MAWNEPNGNGKDPWSGRKDQGPPDLDEAWRKLRAKLFGSGRNNDSQGGGFGLGNGGLLSFGLIAIGILVLWVLSGIFIVAPAEQAVVLRLGRYIKTVGSGPHWIPTFIDRKYVVNVEKISNYAYGALMLTADENIVSVQAAVQYRIANPRDYLFNVVNPDGSLQQAMASALRQVVGHSKLDDVLTTGRAVVRQSVREQLERILKIYNTGIQVMDVAMQPATAPEEVKDAFDDAIRAQEDEQRIINKAEAYSRGVVPIAEGRAKRILQEAEAYKQEVILNAKGNTSRFLALLPEYLLAPKVTRERLYLDAMQAVLSRTSKVLVDIKEGNNILYLPLQQLMQPRQADANTTGDREVTGAVNLTEELASNIVRQSTGLGSSNNNWRDDRKNLRVSRENFQARGQ
ncbi:MAG: FtsH protease activity modulator HflK [Gammaproteobacteria bacterium]